jgi:hypothetical protein
LAESHKAEAVEKLATISQRFSQQPEVVPIRTTA